MKEFLFVSLRDGELGKKVALSELDDVLRSTKLTTVEVEHRILGSEADQIGDVSKYRGVIVGGSALNVTDVVHSDYQQHVDQQLKLLIEQQHTPVYLVCFGIGWLSSATGGLVDNSHPETPGPSVINLSLAAANDPLCAELPPTFIGFTGHKESVAAVSSDTTVLATGPTCPYQFIRYKDQVWASQFHCELDAASLAKRMTFYMDHGYFSPDDYQEIVASLAEYNTSFAQKVAQNFVAHCRSLVTEPVLEAK